MTTEQVQEQLLIGSSNLASALHERAAIKRYPEKDLQRLLDYLHGKTKLFADGLLPADDNSSLSRQITEFFGMADINARYSNHLETSDKVIRHFIEELQQFLLGNNLISEEAKTELLERWPAENRQTSEIN